MHHLSSFCCRWTLTYLRWKENERVKQFGFVQSELDRAIKSTLSRFENIYNERDKTKSAELLQEYVRNYLKGETIPGIEKEFEMHQK